MQTSVVRLLVLLPLGLAAIAEPGQSPAPLNPDTIVQRSLDVIRGDRAADGQFDYSETDSGKNGSKTFAVIMIGGSPYRMLMASGGEPLPLDAQKKEQQKQQRAVSRRCAESSEQTEQRIARYKKEQESEQQMIEQMSKAFTFRLVGEQRLDGRTTWELAASARPGYQPPTTETKALTGMEGKLWIDTATYQWVKVECEVVHPVSMVGFLARVEPGTRFELAKGPVSPSVWMPTHFAMTATAEILSVIGHHSQEDDRYFDYHKAAQNTCPAK